MSLLKLRPATHSFPRRPLLPTRFGVLPSPRLRHSHSAVHAVPPQSAFNGSRLVAAGLAFAAGSVFLVAQSQSTDPSPLPAAALDGSDPLSALSPHVLMSATSHLSTLSVTDLCRQYVVYLASSQSALVSSGPWILKQLEWTRDNVPGVGAVVWGIFAIVSGGICWEDI